MTGIKLQKIDDNNIHLFLEKGMRGGLSSISNKYSESSDDKTIMYWDMNNLHETVMIFDYLPYEDFKFLSEEKIKVFDLYSVPENCLIGYILEVDLEYPTFLHELPNDYSLCPKQIEVGYDVK